MNAIDKLRERDTAESNCLVSLYDESVSTRNKEMQETLLDLAKLIVDRLAQDEDDETEIPF